MGWRRRSRRALLVAIGLGIGFNGVVVAVAPERIQVTYGIAADDPDVAVLLRHRAVMLALVSAFRPVAVPVAAISMATYVLFASTAEANDSQRQVAVVDVVLLVLLAAAAVPWDRREPPYPPRS